MSSRGNKLSDVAEAVPGPMSDEELANVLSGGTRQAPLHLEIVMAEVEEALSSWKITKAERALLAVA